MSQETTTSESAESTEPTKIDLFPFRFLQEALKESGLPYSKPTIIRYERLGVIRPGMNSIVGRQRIDRYYTKTEMGTIIRSLKEYVESHQALRSRN